jgi:hypothetical protein
VAEAEVVEDVAQQDQPLEAPRLQHAQEVARPADRQPEVQVGHDERVGLANQAAALTVPRANDGIAGMKLTDGSPAEASSVTPCTTDG